MMIGIARLPVSRQDAISEHRMFGVVRRGVLALSTAGVSTGPPDCLIGMPHEFGT